MTYSNVKLLIEYDCSVDNLTAKNLAIYVGQFYNTVELTGRYTAHEFENDVRYILDRYNDCHQIFRETIF